MVLVLLDNGHSPHPRERHHFHHQGAGEPRQTPTVHQRGQSGRILDQQPVLGRIQVHADNRVHFARHFAVSWRLLLTRVWPILCDHLGFRCVRLAHLQFHLSHKFYVLQHVEGHDRHSNLVFGVGDYWVDRLHSFEAAGLPLSGWDLPRHFQHHRHLYLVNFT